MFIISIKYLGEALLKLKILFMNAILSLTVLGYLVNDECETHFQMARMVDILLWLSNR